MRSYSLFLLAFVFCLFLQPVVAQDKDDDDEIEVGCGDEEELKKIKKKNTGLAGGGEVDDGDIDAPKVKRSLQERINLAIKSGVKWLKVKQAKNGSYPPVTANRDYKTKKDIGKRYRDELGPSAWAIYTLAKCGLKRSDPSIKKGMKYIFDETEFVWDVMGSGQGQFGGRTKLQKSTRKTPRTLTTYENAAIIMMIEAVFERSAKLTGKHKKRQFVSDNPLKPPARSKIPKKVWKYMNERIVFLTVGRSGGRKSRKVPGLQVANGPNKGGWRYGPGNDADLSATQFALLALRAASQAGYPVEKVAPKVWSDAAWYVKGCQRPNGGFTYQKTGSAVNGSMTGCGVGCLLICKEQMELAGQTPPSWIDDSIKKGMDWLDEKFVATRNPGGNHHYYYLYGVERVGDLAGRKEFNGKDWYVRGAEFLVEHQDKTGMWMDQTEGFPPRDVNSTTLALLFLKRATPPVVTRRSTPPSEK